jgi:hypothetical protein
VCKYKGFLKVRYDSYYISLYFFSVKSINFLESRSSEKLFLLMTSLGDKTKGGSLSPVIQMLKIKAGVLQNIVKRNLLKSE